VGATKGDRARGANPGDTVTETPAPSVSPNIEECHLATRPRFDMLVFATVKAKSIRVTRLESGGIPRRVPDDLAVEEPLEIRVDTRPVSVTMRTPGHDDELAAGYLFTEGVIQKRKDIVAIRRHPRNNPDNVVNVFLAGSVAFDSTVLSRNGFIASSCGLCGKTAISAIRRRLKPIDSRCSVSARVIGKLPGRMRRTQEAFELTGGLHAAAVFDCRGRCLVLREDVGRHNAVDTDIGHALLHRRVPLDRHILVVSGRASFEIMQKALAARIPIVCAVSAPSSLAVEFAREFRQTLVGFLRAEKMNIYSAPWRLLSARNREKKRATGDRTKRRAAIESG
jgi:FdhD protein